MNTLRPEDMRRDEVREAVVSAAHWFVDHIRQILLGTAAAILLGVGLMLYLQYEDRREASASFALSEALEVYRAPIEEPDTDPIADLFDTPPDSAPDDTAAADDAVEATAEGEAEAADEAELSFASEAERRAAAKSRLESVREEYGATVSGSLAAVYLGRIAASDGDTELARELWSEYLAENGDDHALGVAVRLNLYGLDRAEGRAEEVAAELRGAVAMESPALPKEALLFELAATLEQLGDEDGAREAFQRIVDEYPESGYAVRARQQLGPEPTAAPSFTFGG